jgi:hypothetical protein
MAVPLRLRNASPQSRPPDKNENHQCRNLRWDCYESSFPCELQSVIFNGRKGLTLRARSRRSLDGRSVLHDIELRHLYSLIVLAEEMHFTRAVHRLRIARPSAPHGALAGDSAQMREPRLSTPPASL